MQNPENYRNKLKTPNNYNRKMQNPENHRNKLKHSATKNLRL